MVLQSNISDDEIENILNKNGNTQIGDINQDNRNIIVAGINPINCESKVNGKLI